MSLQTLDGLPTLRTERLELRPLRVEDAAALAAMTSHPAILNAIHFLPERFGVPEAEALIRAQGDGRDRFVGLWSRSEGRLAGVLGAHLQGDDRVEIGYWLGVDFHGRGLATEAGKAVLAWLAEAAPARRVVAHALPSNLASRRVLEKLGFRPSGEEPSRLERDLFELRR